MKPERNLKRIDGNWTVDIEVKGKRLRRSFQTKTEAKIALAVLKNQRAMQRLGVEVPETKSHDLIFADFAEKVLAGLGHLRRQTKKDMRNGLNIILRSELFKGKRLSEITTEDVATYHANRGVDRKPSANAELGLMKMIFRRAIEWGELTRNPAGPVKHFRLQTNKLRILTDDEAALLLQAASPALVPLLRLQMTTGMRPHESFALHWEHDGWDTERGLHTSIVDFRKKVIFIPGLLAKNHKDREVPLSPELYEMFIAMRRDSTSDKVFPWANTPRAFMETVKAVGLKNVTFYTLKHTAASRMIKAGVNIVTVSKILGHSDIKMTMIYCHSDAEDERDAIEKVSRIYFKGAPAIDAPVAAQAQSQAEVNKTVN